MNYHWNKNGLCPLDQAAHHKTNHRWDVDYPEQKRNSQKQNEIDYSINLQTVKLVKRMRHSWYRYESYHLEQQKVGLRFEHWFPGLPIW